MDLFEQNIASINRLDPDLGDRLRSGEEDESVVIGGTPEGAPTLGVLRNGKTFLLHHPQTPFEDTRAMIESIRDAHSAWNFIILGIGLGYVPLVLMENRKYPPELMILVEPSISIFREACKNVDLRPILQQASCCLLVGQPSTVTYEALMANLTRILANQVTVIQHPPTRNLFPEWMGEQEMRIRDAWRFGESSLASKHRDGKRYVSNLLSNLPAFARSRGIRTGRSALRGVPAVIVAGGPSLKKNIDRLAEIRKHALVIAVDTVLDRLVDNELSPDIVTTVDPTHLNVRHFRRDSYSGVRLALDPECHPISDRFGENVFTYTTDKTDFFVWLDKTLGPKGTIIKGGMVSQAGFYLARYWGCDPIVFMGQDLALDPDTGDTHHKEAALLRTVRWIEDDPNHVDYPAVDDDDDFRREQLFWVPGKLGGQVPTVQNLLAYLRLLERDVAQTRARVIDATEGGAFIAGTDILTADEVLNLIDKQAFDFESFWERLGRSKPSSEKALTAGLRDIQRRLNRCMDWAVRGREILQKHIQSPMSVDELTKQLDPLRSYIFDDPVTDYFVEQVASATLFEFLKRGPADAAPDCELQETTRRYTALIDATLEACEILREQFKELEID